MSLDDLEERARASQSLFIDGDALLALIAVARAAQPVLARWDSPQWEWTKHGPTADLMNDLRSAIALLEAKDEN